MRDIINTKGTVLGLVDKYLALEYARQGEEELLFANSVGANQHQCLRVMHCGREDVDHVTDHRGLWRECVFGVAIRCVQIEIVDFEFAQYLYSISTMHINKTNTYTMIF